MTVSVVSPVVRFRTEHVVWLTRAARLELPLRQKRVTCRTSFTYVHRQPHPKLTRGARGGERSRGSLITVWRNPRIRRYPPPGCCATIDHAVIRGCDGQCRGKQYFPIYLGLRPVKVESKSNKSRNCGPRCARRSEPRIPAFVARHCRARRARKAR